MEGAGTENGIGGVGGVLDPGIVPAVPAHPKQAPITFSGGIPGPISLPDRRFVVTIDMYCYRLSCAEAVAVLLRFACCAVLRRSVRILFIISLYLICHIRSSCHTY